MSDRSTTEGASGRSATGETMTRWFISFEGESIAMEQLASLGKALAPFNARLYSSEPAFTNCTHIIGLMALPEGWDGDQNKVTP